MKLKGEVHNNPPGASTPTPDGPEERGILCEGGLSAQIGQGRALLVHHCLRSVG